METLLDVKIIQKHNYVQDTVKYIDQNLLWAMVD